MLSRRLAVLAFFASLGLALPARAQRDQMLVTTAWLAQHLHDPNLVLLHVGGDGEYKAMHIPGARFADMDDVSVSEHTAEGLMLEMPSAESLRERLQKLGISNDSRIVVLLSVDDAVQLLWSSARWLFASTSTTPGVSCGPSTPATASQ